MTLPQLKADLNDHGNDYVEWCLEHYEACQATRDDANNRISELERLTAKAWGAIELSIPETLDKADTEALVEQIVLTHTQWEPGAEYYEAGIVMRATRVLMAGGEV